MNIKDNGNVQLLSLNLMNCFVKWKYYQRCRVLPVHHTFLDAQTMLKLFLKFITLSYNDINNKSKCLPFNQCSWDLDLSLVAVCNLMPCSLVC